MRDISRDSRQTPTGDDVRHVFPLVAITICRAALPRIFFGAIRKERNVSREREASFGKQSSKSGRTTTKSRSIEDTKPQSASVDLFLQPANIHSHVKMKRSVVSELLRRRSSLPAMQQAVTRIIRQKCHARRRAGRQASKQARC